MRLCEAHLRLLPPFGVHGSGNTRNMKCQRRWHRLIFVIAVAALLSVCPDTLRTEDAAAQAPAEATSLTDLDNREPGQLEKAEDEARKVCKAKICEIIATRDPNGDNVSCDIVKTWREEDMAKM